MFWLLLTFAFVLQLSTATASVHCVQCAQTLTLNPSQDIKIDGPQCNLQNETSQMCMATLKIDYEQNNASVLFDGFSHDSLNISEETRIITHSMEISLDTASLKRTIQVYCLRNTSCDAEISQIYSTSDISGIIGLQKKLQSDLINSSNSADLLCENNQNETIPCPNGFCQLINNGESSFTRNCIPEGFSAFPRSILIGSSMIEDFENQSAFMYICNQYKCNNLTMAEMVRKLLAQYGLLTPFNLQPIYVVETTMETTTTTTTTTRTSKGITVKMLPQTVVGLQCILLLVAIIFI